MPRTIWKFEWSGRASIMTIEMPKGAVPLSVHPQGTGFNIWAIVDPTKEKEPRKFLAATTGGDFTETNANYIGTVVLDQGYFVLHIFEILPSVA